jgi:hypothetical protein
MTNKIPRPVKPIELFGSIDENFYQLGLRDQVDGKVVHQAVRGMLKTPYKPVNNLIESLGVEVIKATLLKNPNKYPHLKAYAEGMGISVQELYYTMLIPELVSAMTKWAPGLMASNLGCSSFFMRNTNNSIVHGRILDFPLQGTYDLYERTISYQLEGMPKTIGLSTAGIPYPSITCFTENGMTVALHQKFTNIFEKEGESIFEIIFELIKNATDKQSAIEFLKSKISLTTWCLYISFKNGEILAYDLMGKDHFYNEFSLASNEILYFCNHLENKTLDQKNFLPLGFNAYNIMRENSAQKKIINFIKKNNFSDLELLKLMTNPLKIEKSNKLSNYQMDNLTPSSILAVTMNPSEQTIYSVTGDAPKIYQNNIIKFDHLFTDIKIQHIEDKKYQEQNHEYQQGLHALMLAQFGFDNHDPKEIYHQLQFAIDHLENYLDQNMAKFYFLIAQYIYESHPKVLMHLLIDFKELLINLTGYLKEQCLLFIFRLEYILEMPITLEKELIETPRLKSILELELKIPRNIFHITNRKLIVPRIDILDVIYVYTY